jgi:hypothetical protein
LFHYRGEGLVGSPYESASTVLQFVNKSLSGVDTKMDCAQIMAVYANGRINGIINEPQGARTQTERVLPPRRMHTAQTR